MEVIYITNKIKNCTIDVIDFTLEKFTSSITHSVNGMYINKDIITNPMIRVSGRLNFNAGAIISIS